MRNTIPHFVIAGSTFSGLRPLVTLLTAHPAISDKIPTLDFFGSNRYEKKGVDWYVTEMQRYQDARLVGECTPEYLARKNTAVQIVKDFPDTKIVVVIRNPLHRSIEQYKSIQATPVGKRYQRCFDFFMNERAILETSLYGSHLYRYFEYYSALDLHIIVYDDLVTDTYKTVQHLYTFLGVDEFTSADLLPYAPPPDEPKRRGIIGRTIHLPFTLIHAVKKLIHPPKKRTLFTPDPVIRDFLTADELVAMGNFYARDLALLSQLLHRDMASVWEFDQFKKE